MKLKTNRMEALVDGIFAIIMTIMIVNLSEILSFTNPLKNTDFYVLFLNLGNDFIIYAVSFLILGILWFEHHWQFHYIKHIDPVLVFINIVWFMFVCLIPFLTMLMGNHVDFFAPILVFQFNILIVFLILHVHWAYVTRQSHLIEESLDKKNISRHGKIGLCIIFFMLLVIVLTFVYHYLIRKI